MGNPAERRKPVTKKEMLPLKMECTMLFQSNPLIAITVQELERKLNKAKEELQPVLSMLIKQGIIQQTGDGANLLFRYQEPATIEEIGLKGELKNS
jgi:hypothetical protein